MQAAAVERYLRDLQNRICDALAAADGAKTFLSDAWSKPPDAPLRGDGDTRILEDGALFERAGVGFSLVAGDALPPSASAQRPELAGRGFRATGVSLVLHPRNPFVPTTHMNLRLFVAEKHGEAPTWWFGGGFDLTPYYVFEDDARHWHTVARDAAGEHYAALKQRCDEYFYLRHRGETRGIGGLFFDDWQQGGFDASFELLRRVGDAFLDAYLPIVERRRDTPYGERERSWQLYRRGRYVEFNLVFDRGTLFGLQSGGRTESILMSMPPLAAWRYDYRPQPGSPEARLAGYLQARDWLA